MDYHLLFWFVILLCIEAFALYCVRKSSDSPLQLKYLMISCILYAIIPILLYIILVKTHKIGVLNCSWNVASNIYGLMIAVLIFSEVYTKRQLLGFILGFLAIMLMNSTE